MKTKLCQVGGRFLSVFVVLVAMCSVPVFAQNILTQQKLDQLLAPIALYPDALLSQVLMAATYPLEVTQAAAFVQKNPQLHGDQLAQASGTTQWDVSIRSLLPFPSVLLMMEQNLPWMQQLGDAFLGQQQAVMDTVQELRSKASQAGHLRSDQQEQVIADNGYISIEPGTSDQMYVPYYNPDVVYGNWWWPDSPPIYWQPPIVYRSPGYNNELINGMAFGIGIGIVGSLFLDARPDWHRHHMMVYPEGQRGRAAGGGSPWRHQPQHRQGVAYRSDDVRQQFAPQRSSTPSSVMRENFRGRIAPAVVAGPAAAPIRGRPEIAQPQASFHHMTNQAAAPIEVQRLSEAKPVHQLQRTNMGNPGALFHPMMPSGSRQENQAHSARGQQSLGPAAHAGPARRNK
ncbi:DUF3300 domain-containing protein [Undibacterium jejuense]|uniref:DUF3300 domain-containing protein n=1 Tax=Undibacterium jejuense TaxID=1344949 RepID=A0A923HG20_9BURK|nr:DUF3300 domain-containing protein [Undibacterium jejuense]MBC3863371.1 DUF3300 domain-containing protein [Undibacterium jejuense]